jgi:hypothetical protein
MQMSVKIIKKLKLLKLIDDAREDFKEELEKTVPPEIRKTIEGGNNPIKGGKQAKYSESYLKAIAGSKKTKSTTQNAYTPLKQDKNGNNRKSKKVTSKGLGFGKKPSPVNLILSGEMINTLKSYQTVRGLFVYFADKKAEWHNEGVPENNLPARRLLPNNPGEEFNRNIFNRIMDSLKKAVKKNL